MGEHVLVHCDNMAVVEAIKAKSSHDKQLMHMLRSMHFLGARHNVRVSAQHIPGIQNSLADALSRNNMSQFLLSLPKADRVPTHVPDDFLDLVMGTQPDWRAKLHSFSNRVCEGIPLTAVYLHQLLHSSRTHIAASRSGDTHSVRSRTGPDTGALNYQELLVRQSDISM